MLTAVWLLMTPLMELEDGPRAVAVIVVGLATLVLAPLSVWSRRAGSLMALLGAALGIVNFVVPGLAGSMADLATCGIVLAIAGLAPSPVVNKLPAVAAPVARSVATPARVAFNGRPAAAVA
jgi:disulfide bond formation protein DsbB